MNKFNLRFAYFVVPLLVVVWFGGGLVGAVPSSEFRMKVLPLECLFEYVNDGSNQLVYITPEECGQAGVSVPPASPEVPETARPAMSVADVPNDIAVPPGSFQAQALLDPPSSDDRPGSPATEGSNVVTPLGRLAQAGQTFVENPVHTLVGAGAIVTMTAGLFSVPVSRRTLLRWLSAASKMLFRA